MSKKLIVETGTLHKKAQGEPGEGPSFEQQFGILANAQITDKYPSLSNYQVAVQLLDKNDDNSFAVCAVVYKLGKNYIYVPAFFRNGKISTGEMMEVPGLQTFLPLSDAWLTWVKNKENIGDADLIDASEANLYGNAPATARAREPIDPILKNASAKETNIFSTVLKMGKTAAAKFMDYLTKPWYINEAFKFYSPEQIAGFAKKACELYPEAPEPELITMFDKKASQLTDEQKAVLWRDGYVIKKAELVDWDQKDSTTKVIQKKNIDDQFVTPDDSCKCQLLQPDGALKDVKLLRTEVLHTDKAKPLTRGWEIYGGDSGIEGSDFKYFIVDDGKAVPVKGHITAVKSSMQKLDTVGKAFSSFSSEDNGDLILVLPSGKAISVNSSFQKAEDGSLFNYSTVIRESDDERLKDIITYGRTIDVPEGTKILISKWAEKPFNADIGDLGRAIEKYINKKAIKVKMTSDGQEVSFFGPASKPSDRFMEKEAALHLVKNYGVAPKDAKMMLKIAGAAAVDAPKTVTFLLSKQAAEQEESDMWEPADIGYSEITENPPTVTQEDLQNKAMQTEEQQMDTITKATEAGVKEVFDTATLKLLLQDADPHETFMDVIPDLMKTLDRLCQMLFLYRAHMQDMEEKYGATKMKALEKALQNTIKDLSELTVFIKLRGMGNGQSPDAGDLQTGTMMQ